MPLNSRTKGACGEREAAAAIQQHLGVACSRMGRSGRTAEDLDHHIPGVHIEVKRPARIAVMGYMKQAERDCDGKTPIVLMRANRDEWTVMVRLADLLQLCGRVAAIEGRPIFPEHAAEPQEQTNGQ